MKRKVEEEEDSIPTHWGVFCDECGQLNIKGIRHKCGHCPDYDLCQICHTFTKHDTSHCFIIIKDPAYRPPCDKALLPPPQDSLYFGVPQGHTGNYKKFKAEEKPKTTNSNSPATFPFSCPSMESRDIIVKGEESEEGKMATFSF